MSIFSCDHQYAVIGAYYCLNLDHYNMDLHSHRCCEIMYSIKGECTIGFIDTQITLTEGQFIFIDSYIPHQLLIEAGHPCVVANLEFYLDKCIKGLDIGELRLKMPSLNDFLGNPVEYLVLNDTGNMCYALKDIIMELELNDSMEEKSYLTNMQLARVLIELGRCYTKKESLTGIQHVRKAQKFIEENLCSDLDVPKIANSTFVSRAYLEKLFKKNLHCGIMTYVCRLRLKKATFMLKNSSKTITEIAFEVGFNSRQYFAHAFENFYGVSPKEFRNCINMNIKVTTQGFVRN